jgi:type I restriction enzyme S subunit
MSYKTLGDYIQPVNIRNKDLEVTTLLGVSIRKVLMPSIANTIGTNMKTYKIIKQNQFAYGPVTSRNGDRISMALLEEHEIAIVSQAYTVFEVIDEQEVLPEYLMMWFRRPEFDRFARFKSHGSAREVFDWEELCDTQLPIPSIEKQQQIVAEYNTVTNRINLNNQLTQNLEATVKALYKHWFVDFEFPNTENKPYKSSGGLMVYNEELDKDIPVGWSVESIGSLCQIGSSKRVFQKDYVENGIPFYRSKEIILKKKGELISEPLFISDNHYSELKSKYDIPKKNDILLTAVGTLGISYRVSDETFYFKDGNLMWFKDFLSDSLSIFIYDFMQSKEFEKLIKDITIGSTQKAITINTMSEKSLVKPIKLVLDKYSLFSNSIRTNQKTKSCEKESFTKLQSLLLAKMTQQETKTQAV